MGRGKIEIKRIENLNNRHVTYNKRRTGIIKKAREISVLCDAKVSLVIFSSSGKMHEYCTPSTTVADVLDKYHTHSGKRLWDAKHENLSNETDRVKKENDNLQVELRHLKGEDINSLQYYELMRLEEALENGLTGIRQRQMEIYKMHKKNEKTLQEEHERLAYMDIMDVNMMRSAPEIDQNGHNYHHPQERDYHHGQQQLPFLFQLQPMQPKLQERM